MVPGARNKFGDPFQTWGLSEANVLLKKVLPTFLGLFGAPIVIWRPGN